jgi:hypothetical protein
MKKDLVTAIESASIQGIIRWGGLLEDSILNNHLVSM